MIITKAVLFLCLFYGPWILAVPYYKNLRDNLCFDAVARATTLCFIGLGFAIQSDGSLTKVSAFGILFSMLAIYYSKPGEKKAPLEGALYDRENNRIL